MCSVPVNALLGADEVRYIVHDSGAAAVFVGPETAGVGVAAAGGAGIPTIGWRCDEHPELIRWDRWVADAPDEEPPTDRPAAELLFYTSGTTGYPKGTLSRQPLALRDVAECVAWWQGRLAGPLGRGCTPCLVIGPMHHHGPITSSIEGVFGGGTHILDRFDPEAVLAAVERLRAGSLVAVPTHFVRLLALPDEVRARYDVSSLHFVGQTGASCPVAVKRAMIDWWGPVICEAYGGTESGVVTHRLARSGWSTPAASGAGVDAFEPVVVDDDGRPAGARTRSAASTSATTPAGGSPTTATPEKTAEAYLEPGVFTLGDIGYVDDDGYVYITDRAADMIVSGGVNIYPAEIERVLVEHPGVADVRRHRIPDDDLGETPLALVEPSDHAAPPSIDDLADHCRRRLAGYKCPSAFEIVPSVQRTAMGKLEKRRLRAPYWPDGPHDRGLSRVSGPAG